MKKVFLLLFLLTIKSHTQTFKGIIILNPLKGIGDETKLSENAKKPIYFSYLYSNEISKQELISKEGNSFDLFLNDTSKGLNFENGDIVIRPYSAVHYKNFSKNIYRFESEKIDQNTKKSNISIKDSIPIYNWNLLNETQFICGYECKKATTTKKTSRLQSITAWYCEKLAISDGPLDFTGLPGLILQIEINNSSIVKFENIKLLEDEYFEIEEPINHSKMQSFAEYKNRDQ